MTLSRSSPVTVATMCALFGLTLGACSDPDTVATTAPSIEDAGFESRGSEEPQETIASGQVGAFDSSGLGSFEALVGVGIVVEATVTDQLGPEKFINDIGALGWRYSPPEAEDDAALWTTPYGTPMLVLDDLRVLLTVSGRPEAEAASDEIERAAQDGEKLEIGAPVGLYQVGERYEFWVSPWRDVGYFSYLAFDDGKVVEGLGLPDPDAAFESLQEFTGASRIEALAVMAEDMTNAWDSGEQGELVDHFFGPVEQSGEGAAASSGHYPIFADEIVDDGTDYVALDISIFGADPDLFYSVQGSKLLGWSSTDDHGMAGLIGFVPLNEELIVVARDPSEERATRVEGAPSFVVAERAPSKEEPLMIIIDIEDTSGPTVRTDVTLQELDERVRDAMGLPPET